MDSEIGGWKYKEVRSRKGQVLIFGRLDELLLSIFHESTLGGLDQHKSNYQEQYICNCPFCKEEGHTKKKLHILPNTSGHEDFSTGYCFVCGRTFIHVTDEIKTDFRVPNFLTSTEPFKVQMPTDQIWTLEKFEDEFDFYSEEGVKYLIGRNPMLKDLWKPLGFKFYEDHVAMPFRDPDGNLIYYQIRFIDANKDFGIRFHFPITTAKPPYILHGPNADPSKLLVCEGIFDCVAAWIQCGGNYVCVALMGSKVSDYQLAFVRNWYMPKKIVFWMDETELSMKVRDRFKTVFPYSVMSVVRSDQGYDPEEILISKMKEGRNVVWLKPEYGDQKLGTYFPKFDLKY